MKGGYTTKTSEETQFYGLDALIPKNPVPAIFKENYNSISRDAEGVLLIEVLEAGQTTCINAIQDVVRYAASSCVPLVEGGIIL